VKPAPISCLIDYVWFYVPLMNFSLIDAGEGLQICLALRAFEQGGIRVRIDPPHPLIVLVD
jgi:hypothetical protein